MRWASQGLTREDNKYATEAAKAAQCESVTKGAKSRSDVRSSRNIALLLSGIRGTMRGLRDQRRPKISSAHYIQHTFEVVDHRSKADLGLGSL